MLRFITLTVLGGGFALSFAPSTRQQPPSSLEPVHRGVVSFSHEATRVVACTRKTEGKKLQCSPEREPTDASTSLVLHPIAESAIVAKDQRQNVQVSLPKEGGHAEKVDLGVGLWEMDWAGPQDRHRFYVSEGDEFGIQLRTALGACKKVKDDCVLRTDKTLREVKIPDRCRR
jgi:hypothetical protein